MLAIHDNVCSGYRFQGEIRRLVLETEYPSGAAGECRKTEVIFEGVWCHHLESVQEGNIIFDIRPIELPELEREFYDLLKRLKNYGWPRMELMQDSLSAIIERKGLKIYRISSSYGMEGFVMAETVHQMDRD